MAKRKCILYSVLSVILGLLISSCTNPNQKSPNLHVIDLRNKTSNGTIYRSVVNNVFSCDFDEANSEIPEATAAWAKDTITVSDCDQGVKFTFHRPEACNNYLIDWFDIHIVDSNGQEYARTSLPEQVRNEHDSNGKSTVAKETIDIIFPLVLPGKDVSMYAQYGYRTSNYSSYHTIKLSYNIHTAHGTAMPDALPAKFDCSANIEIIGGRYMRVFDVIPPEGNNLELHAGLWEHNEDGTENDRISFKAIPESEWTTTDTVTKGDKEIIIDCSKFSNPARNKPLMYGDFLFTYTLDAYPDQTFGTVTFISKKYENTFFISDN